MLTSLLFASAIQDAKPVDLADLSAFRTSIDQTLKLRALKNVVVDLTRSSSAKFVVDPEVAELKVTLHITDRSLGWTLDRIAEVLDLEWVNNQGQFRIQMSAAARQAVEDTKRRQISTQFDQIRKQWKAIAEVTRMPFSVARKEQSDLANLIQQIQKERNPGWSDRLDAAYQKFGPAIQAFNVPNQALGAAVRQFELTFEQTVRSGRLFLASTMPYPGVFQLTLDFDDNIPPPLKNPETILVAKLEGDLDYLAYSWYGSQVVHRDYGKILASREVPFESLQHAQWKSKPGTISSQLSETPFHVSRSILMSPHPSSSDVLIEAAKAMELDLVADAFHDDWHLSRQWPTTIRSFWSELASEKGGPSLKVKDSAILFRHKEFWIQRDREIAESKLAAISHEIAEGRLTLDSLSQYVAGLTDIQRSALANQPPFRRSDALATTLENLDLVLFWFHLNPEERRRALGHDVVPFVSLNPKAKEALRSMVLFPTRPTHSHGSSIPAEPLFALLSGQTSELAFLLEPVHNRFVGETSGNVKVLVPIEDAPAGATANTSWNALHFRFGTSAEKSILRVLDIPLGVR